MDAMKSSSVRGSTGVAVLLFLIAIVLAGLVFVEVASLYVSPAAAQSAVEEASRKGNVEPNDVGQYIEPSKELAEGLKKKNLFAKQPPKKHPVNEVAGIFGREVLIGDKWYSVGDKVGDAKIVAIEPTEVKIEWEGNVKTFAPIAAATKGGPAPPKPEPAAPKEPTKVIKKADQQVKEATVEVVEVAEEDPFAFLGREISPELRAKLLEKWNEMSDEEKAQAKEQWENMPDEQKDQALDMMEQNIDNL